MTEEELINEFILRFKNVTIKDYMYLLGLVEKYKSYGIDSVFALFVSKSDLQEYKIQLPVPRKKINYKSFNKLNNKNLYHEPRNYFLEQ